MEMAGAAAAGRYLFSLPWVHTGRGEEEPGPRGGWRSRLRGGAVGGQPGQHVEGRLLQSRRWGPGI